MSVRLFAIHIASVLLVVILIANLRAQDSNSFDRKPTSISGCMTSACHGASVAPDTPTWQRSGKIWFDQDPHAQAYTDLLTQSSQRIVEKLSNRSQSVSSDEYRQFLEEKCVSCHASEHAPAEQRTLGVDCQSCHGPADAWDQTHYSKQWQSLGAKRFDQTRMLNMESISSRAAICSSCHVGELNRQGREREVDHRLMAAGHPAMHFDFELFSQRYPKHWAVSETSSTESHGNSFRQWQIGKLQASIVRLKLLAARVEPVSTSGSARDWPELTEYSCYSCHHKLDSPSWRPPRGSTNSFVWDSWLTSQLDIAINEKSSASLSRHLAELKAAMEKSLPNAPQVREMSISLLRLLEIELATKLDAKADANSEMQNLQSQLGRVLKNERKLVDWESAAQWYVASTCLVDDLRLEAIYSLKPSTEPDRFFGRKQTWDRKDKAKSTLTHGSSLFHPKMFNEYREELAKQLMPQP